MADTGNAADLWLRSRQHPDPDAGYRHLLDQDDAPDYTVRLEEALAQRTLELSEATERALAWEWAYREEAAKAARAARWGARWRDVALLALGAGSLVVGRLRGQP